VPYFILTFVVFEEVGRGYGRSRLIEQYNMARFAAFMWATLGLIRGKLRFKVTSKDTLTTTQVEARAISPQILITALNALAIVIAAALWPVWRHLPLDGLLANLLWAGINCTMAFVVVRFTLRRTRFRRHEYRFPVPLPAYVRIGDSVVLMTVDDISSSGCRLYGPFPDQLGPGDRISGTLSLPGGPLDFQAHVAVLFPGGPDNARYTKAIGLAFDWHDATSRDHLDLFLYGSNLQWQLKARTERVRTPTEVLRQMLTNKPEDEWDIETWAALALDHGRNPDETALISRGRDAHSRRMVLSQCYLEGVQRFDAREHTRIRATALSLRPLRHLARLDTPTGALYLTEVEAC